ncbi:MAG TPA: hypothetical protein VHV47_10935, partial [Opitutaceae bacterium]|nr:hypothetical protein [Opitutaceae bacterium]
MKTNLRLLGCGLLLAFVPALASAAGTSFIDKIFPPLPKAGANVVSGIFWVYDVHGTAECLADGRIWNLAKGERVLARGAVVRTKDNARVTLLFSNQTSLSLEQNASMKVEKFDQEPFQPNNDLQHEPSSSQMLVYVNQGAIVIATPQLYSGTHIVFETQHCACAVLNGQSGGEKAFIEVSDVQTHFGMIQGRARINTRLADGDFDYVARYLPDAQKNNQAFVKYTDNGSSSESTQTVDVAGGGDVPATAAEAAASSQGAPAKLAAGIDLPQDSFYVAKAVGEVDCVVKGRSFALKPSDSLIARGAIVTTLPNSSATLLFSNHTSIALGEKAEIKVDKYDQEAFKPNNTLDLEPSNSQSLILVHYGRLEVTTPQLLSGTSLVFESAHGTVKLLNGQSGGDRAYLAVTPKQTTVQMGNGSASLAPRNPDGSLQTISTPLTPGPMATIKPAVGAVPTIEAAFARQAPAAAAANGNFSVSALTGELDCVVGGTSLVLKAGQSVPAAGASLRTAPGSSATLAFSNQANLQLGEKTGLRIEQFEQEAPAAASSNPLVEPGVSRMRVLIATGSVEIDTPELRSASRVILETPHTSVLLVGGTSGGQQAGLVVGPKATRVNLVAGKAHVSPRGLDGEYVAAMAGTELLPGQQATVQPTLDGRSAIAAITNIPADAAPVAPAGTAVVAEPAQAVVLEVVGLAKSHAPNGGAESVLAVGDQLPTGSEIVTSAGAQVYLQAFIGAVANIQPDTDVVLEKIETEAAGQTVMGRT